MRAKEPREMNRIHPKWKKVAAVAGIWVTSLAIAVPEGLAWEWATGPSVYDEEGKRDWSVELVPYLFLSGLNGDLALPAGTGTIPVDASFGDLASNLDAAFSGFLDVRYRRWHLMSDNFWVRLSVEQRVEVPGQFPPLEAMETDVDLDQAFGSVVVAYELPLNRSFALDLYAGARWWYVTNTTTFSLDTGGPGAPGPFTGELTESWWDGIVGLRWRLPITKKWQVAAYGDIGAGAANLDWSVGGNVAYYFNHYVGLTAGYRVLGLDYENDGFLYDVRMNGFLLGLNLRY